NVYADHPALHSFPTRRSSDLIAVRGDVAQRNVLAQNVNQFTQPRVLRGGEFRFVGAFQLHADGEIVASRASAPARRAGMPGAFRDRKSTRLNSSHSQISYAVF